MHGFEVDGFDLDARMLECAAAKSPEGRFVVADMIGLDLVCRYDVIVSLFSSIGYVRTLENLVRTLASCRRHLERDVLLIVEPWFAPGVLEHGRVHVHSAEPAVVKVCRIGRTAIEGGISGLEFEYLIGRAAGIVRVSETHELGLFAAAELDAAFRQAGFEVDHAAAGLTGRGLYVARPHDSGEGGRG